MGIQFNRPSGMKLNGVTFKKPDSKEENTAESSNSTTTGKTFASPKIVARTGGLDALANQNLGLVKLDKTDLTTGAIETGAKTCGDGTLRDPHTLDELKQISEQNGGVLTGAFTDTILYVESGSADYLLKYEWDANGKLRIAQVDPILGDPVGS